VDKKDLPVAIQLAEHRVADQFFVESRHTGLDRQPIFRRRFEI
jgi:hypothetical protein